ncbi:MAG TPA: hypothetical protein VF463_15485 [Sphingobium sp.]
MVDDAADLAALWTEAVEGLQDIIERHNKDARPRLTSFAMKSLWYYQPERATMWDSYAVVALNYQSRTRHLSDIRTADIAEAFLADFDTLFTANAALIGAEIADV